MYMLPYLEDTSEHGDFFYPGLSFDDHCMQNSFVFACTIECDPKCNSVRNILINKFQIDKESYQDNSIFFPVVWKLRSFSLQG